MSTRPLRPSLTDLEITDLGIIDRVTLSLAPGLNVLTGETGAGKTMVVSALQWLVGGRADRDKVRLGARAAVIQGRVHPLPASAEEWADDADDGLIVTREVAGRDTEGGRSRARVAGRLAPVASLAEVLGPLVEIHSQHEGVRLADTKVQRALLDRYGGDAVATARAAYDEAHRRWRDSAAELREAERIARDGAREADRLRFEVGEIDTIDPQPGEEDQLDVDIARLSHADAIRLALDTATQAIQSDDGARESLGAAVAALRGVIGHDEALAPVLERLESLLAEAQELAIDLDGHAEDLDADPAALDRALSRRAAIGGLLRKYGATTTEVIAFADQARERLALIDGGEERLEQLRDSVARHRRTLDETGEGLRAAREKAGLALSEVVDGHLTDLAMPDARMSVRVDAAEPGADGADEVEFLLAANRGQPALPISRAASGGERSRIALAVRVALADADDTPVIVFDEVDVGIGGQTALAVGQKLAALSNGRQVLCVTHLAQLAAFADAHFVVRKAADDATTTTSVTALRAADRPEELSRMLSGAPDSDAALTHATELLEKAAAAR